ncbi:MAG: ATP-binding cassette domain-containing protein [Ruminococcaceae bacterium]|nr:ATP-binding cassette domain-containing protein [Oscillospiraceae bacterium]
MSNNQETLLKVENLCQYFGFNRAVDDVSFEVKKGEVFGLVGESGCGKTTTGRSIIKLYNITSGSIYFKGIRISAGIRSYQEQMKTAKAEYAEKVKNTADPAEKALLKGELDAIITNCKKEIKRARFDQKNCDKEFSKQMVLAVKTKYQALLSRASETELAALKAEYKDELRKARKTKLVTQIQMIFQDPIASLDPRMTVREIISEGLIIRGERNKKVIDEKVYEMLELVGLVREHASRYPHEFSGGQRQRIGVARAIIMNPELIIADEPVSALDVSIQAQVINLLNDLRHSLGLTILFIAHDLSVVKYFSDRIGVMYYGKMVELTTSDELFKNPLHPYTKSLLSAIPLPDPIYEKNRKRIVYNRLAEHDYSVNKPSLREVAPGHFVECNDEEFEKYKALLSAQDQK